MKNRFSKNVAQSIKRILESHELYGYIDVQVKNNQIAIQVVDGDFVDYLLLPMSSEQGYIVIRSVLNRRLGEWEETDRWHVVSDGSAEDMALEIVREVWGLDGFRIPDLDWELNPRRKNPVSTGTLLALGIGYFLGKK